MLDASLVAGASRTDFSGDAWRHVAPRRLPLSSDGARLNGGRFNPPDSFGALYLCTSRACAVNECRRLADRNALALDAILPRYLYRIEVECDLVLDLTNEAVRAAAGVTLGQLLDADWSVCQELGGIVHSLGLKGIRSPSATGTDDVLSLFPQRFGDSTITPVLVEEWHRPQDLDGK